MYFSAGKSALTLALVLIGIVLERQFHCVPTWCVLMQQKQQQKIIIASIIILSNLISFLCFTHWHV